MLAGYTGSARCNVIVNGEAELGVDLEQARFADIDAEARTATLVLPEPKVRKASLDHACTQVYSLDREGLWWLLPLAEPDRALMNQAMREAQACIKTAAQNTQLAKQARQQAEGLVNRAFTRVGWRVRIVWVEGVVGICIMDDRHTRVVWAGPDASLSLKQYPRVY